MARILSILSFNLVAVRRQGVDQLADLTGDLRPLRITAQFLELPSELGVEVNLEPHVPYSSDHICVTPHVLYAAPTWSRREVALTPADPDETFGAVGRGRTPQLHALLPTPSEIPVRPSPPRSSHQGRRAPAQEVPAVPPSATTGVLCHCHADRDVGVGKQQDCGRRSTVYRNSCSAVSTARSVSWGAAPAPTGRTTRTPGLCVASLSWSPMFRCPRPNPAHVVQVMLVI